jgi:hypothetical protein
MREPAGLRVVRGGTGIAPRTKLRQTPLAGTTTMRLSVTAAYGLHFF